MSEETTQVDLSAELDRLSAMRGDEDGEDDEDDDSPALRLSVHDARFRPETVRGHELRALCDEGPADLRGQRVGVALHALRREGVRATRAGERIRAVDLVDAVGGPDLSGGYVVDRQTGTVLAVDATGDPVELVVAGSGPVGEQGTERRLDPETLATATVAGYRDRERYRRYDAYGRPD